MKVHISFRLSGCLPPWHLLGSSLLDKEPDPHGLLSAGTLWRKLGGAGPSSCL